VAEKAGTVEELHDAFFGAIDRVGCTELHDAFFGAIDRVGCTVGLV